MCLNSNSDNTLISCNIYLAGFCLFTASPLLFSPRTTFKTLFKRLQTAYCPFLNNNQFDEQWQAFLFYSVPTIMKESIAGE